MLAVAALAMVGTLPGRTQGLGLITEPLLTDLGLDRLAYARINFWATIIGAAGAIGVGRLMDRFGSRVVLTAVAVSLGVVVCLMSGVTSLILLSLLVTLTRALGQSALSVVSIAMVGHWFSRRIDMAMAVYSIALSVGFMIAFPIVGSVVQQRGWRTAWLSVGVALLVVLAPVAWLIVRHSPESAGLRADEHADEVGSASSNAAGYAWTEALSTGAFWIFAIGTAFYGLVASGIGLFNESILAERGFGPGIYYQTLVVTAMTGLAGNFAGGWLSTRVDLTRLLSAALFVLAAGLVALPHVSTVVQVMAWAGVMGIGGGLVMVLFFSVWPRIFGRRHLGRIQGAAQALTVLASALGPLLLAWCIEVTGSYAAMFRVLSFAIAATAVAALVVSLPKPAAAPSATAHDALAP